MNEHKNQFIPTMKSPSKIKDSVTLGLASGLIGTLALDVVSLFFWKGKKTESLYGHIAGSILMKGFRTKKRGNFIFGQIIHMITGALAGIPLAYAFKATGKDHQVLKGATFGSIVWMVYYVFGIKSHTFTTQPKLNRSHKSTLFQNMFYGIATAKALTALAHPSIFKERSEIDIQSANNGQPSINSWGIPHYSDYETERPIH